MSFSFLKIAKMCAKPKMLKKLNRNDLWVTLEVKIFILDHMFISRV